MKMRETLVQYMSGLIMNSSQILVEEMKPGYVSYIAVKIANDIFNLIVCTYIHTYVLVLFWF